MICVEVSLNGDVICTVGNDQGSVNVNIRQDSVSSEISLHEIVYRPGKTGDDLAPKLRAALQHHERPPSAYPVYWIDRKQLKPGDEITIKLVDIPANPLAPNPDSPPESNQPVPR